MAWGDLADNQMVSFTDAQTGGFTLQTGQSHTASNQCMTKSQAVEKYHLDNLYLSGFTNSQLVPKSNWKVGIYGFDWPVYDIKIQSDGKILVGGTFDTYRGATLTTPNLVRLFPDGTLDTSFNASGTGPLGDVRSIYILPDGRIAIGGDFIWYNGTVVNRICILNPEGTLNTTLTGCNSTVETIAFRGEYLYIGGNFTSLNGSPAGYIGAIHMDTGVKSPSFSIGSGFNNSVMAIHIGTDNEIYVGGYFLQYKSSTAKGLVKLQDNGNILRNYNLAARGYAYTPIVNAITTTSDYRVVAGGDFKETSGTPYTNIVAFNTDGTVYNVFGTGLNSDVFRLDTFGDNQLLVSGRFGNYDGEDINVSVKMFFGLQRYNIDINYTPDFNGEIYAHAIDSNGNVLYGGLFTIAADTSVTKTVNRIAKFSSTGTLLSI
jgi:hypothetical protein